MPDNFYETLLDNMYDGVYYVDMKKNITYWNKGAERITGFKKDEVVGNCCSNNILRHIDDSGNELCISGCPLGETLMDSKNREANLYLHHKNGHRVPVSIRISPILDENGEIIGGIEIFSDNSKDDEKKKEIERLKKEVFTDALTGASNRKYAEMMIDNYIIEQKAIGMKFGFIFLDVDHFKNFNDTYGHKTGDDVLKMVTLTMKSVIRNFDSVCRLGGEEFVVLLPNITKEVLVSVAERIRSFIEKSWITAGDEKLSVTVSIGGTLAADSDSVASLIERADHLMYESKTGGRNRVTID